MIEKILTEICRLKKDLEGYSAQEALDQIEAYINLISRNPPLPSNLDEAAEKYSQKEFPNEPCCGQWGTGDYEPPVDMEYPREVAGDAFKAGAKWMQDQFEKNRLANCDKLTKEEYDRETDFATEIIEKEHRQPTFTDAINYGIRVMKEYLMNEAVEGFFTKSIDGEDVFAESTALDVDPKSVKVGDKVKLIVIKEGTRSELRPSNQARQDQTQALQGGKSC